MVPMWRLVAGLAAWGAVVSGAPDEHEQPANTVPAMADVSGGSSGSNLLSGAIMVPLGLATGARCLDGSPYAFYIIPGDTAAFTIGLHGGGWCYDEPSCVNRSRTALGTSTLWNATSCFGPPAFSCYGLSSNCTRVFMPYCDGSSFTSYREAPWLVQVSLWTAPGTCS